MKQYFRFLLQNPKPLGFGFFLTFFSSLGQTFFISLYVPSIIRDLGISNTFFGTVYAGATIGSSMLLMVFGHEIDHKPLRPYVYRTIWIMAGALALLSAAINPWLLPIAILGLRFSGQGLLSHISQTVMSRHFHDARGKALSLTALGYSVGEMVFPLLVTRLTPLLGWRMTLLVNASLLFIFLIPLLKTLPLEDFEPEPGQISSKPQWQILKHRSFWTIAPLAISLAFTNTAVFFYQLILAESRGWNIQWYGSIFAGYAMVRFAAGFIGGPLVDRFGARNILPLHIIPMIFGLLVLGLVDAPWSAIVFLGFAGISLGLDSPVKSAAIAEIHGTIGLGGIRGVYTAFMVFGTSLGPLTFGWLLDKGINFPILLAGSSVLLLLASIPAFYSRKMALAQ